MIGWLQDCLRWWDHWLKGEDNGVTEEPVYTAWMFDPDAPVANATERGGRWVGEKKWKSPRITEMKYLFNGIRLDTQTASDETIEHHSPLSLGMAAGGDWCRIGVPGEGALDQREDDARSLAFTSDPLPERLEILGAPVVELEICADQLNATVALRLNDVAADGTSSRVSYGFLNLTHRDGHSHPAPLEPGKFFKVRVTLNQTAYAFPAGHRLRVALSTSYWPYIWPSPQPVTLRVRTLSSYLTLPRRPIDRSETPIVFEPAESAPPVPMTILEQPSINRTFNRDLITGLNKLVLHYSGGYMGPGRLFRLEPIGVVIGHEKTHVCEILDDDPLSARYVVSQTYDIQRDGKRFRLFSRIAMRASEEKFFTEAEARAYENDVEVCVKHWVEDYPRYLV